MAAAEPLGRWRRACPCRPPSTRFLPRTQTQSTLVAVGEDPGVEERVAASCRRATDARRRARRGRPQRPPRARPGRRRAPARRRPARRRTARRPLRAAGRGQHVARRGARGAANIRAGAARRPRRSARWNREPMPKRAARAPGSGRAGNRPSPRLASVIGHRPATAPLRAMRRGLAVGHVGGVDQAPARVDRRVGRAAIRPAARRDQARQSSTSFICSATWMWIGPSPASGRHRRAAPPASPRAGCAARRRPPRRAGRATARAARFEQPREAVDVVDEAALARLRRLRRRSRHARRTPAAASGRCRSRSAAAAMRAAISAEVGIGRAVAVVVQVVELADRGEAGLQHLDIELRGDRLDLRPASCVSAKRYITSRQVQKLSAAGPRVSARPAMPRWKAWLCRLGMPGSATPWRSSRGLRGALRSRPRRSRRRRRSSRTSSAQPSGSSACVERTASSASACTRWTGLRAHYV